MADFLVIQRASVLDGLPEDGAISEWVEKALLTPTKQELVVRIIDEAEMTELNGQFRQKSGSTNVLTFPAELPMPVFDSELLPMPGSFGDIAICAPVVECEAVEQEKSIESHWAHMVIHSVLHLQGYDHISSVDAERMESLEIQLLTELGYPDPYKIK